MGPGITGSGSFSGAGWIHRQCGVKGARQFLTCGLNITLQSYENGQIRGKRISLSMWESRRSLLNVLYGCKVKKILWAPSQFEKWKVMRSVFTIWKQPPTNEAVARSMRMFPCPCQSQSGAEFRITDPHKLPGRERAPRRETMNSCGHSSPLVSLVEAGG